MSEYIHQQLNEQLRDALLALYLTYALPEDSSLPPSTTYARLMTFTPTGFWMYK